MKKLILNYPNHKILLQRLEAIGSNALDEIVAPIATKETNAIDCTQCGKCCAKLQPPFSDEDIEKITTKNELAENWQSDLLVFDYRNNIHYLKKSPCSFLCGTKCRIYQSRPAACATYPGLNLPHFKYRLSYFLGQYNICPIVKNTLDRLETQLNNTTLPEP